MTTDVPSPQTSSPWRELGPGIYVLRTARFRMNVGLVVGSEQALVVDTGAGPLGAAEVYAHVRAVTGLPLVVVNTHAHASHYFGNDYFAAHGVEEFWATSRCSAVQAEKGEEQRVLVLAVEPAMGAGDGEHTRILPANRLVEGKPVDLDLGGLSVTLFHLGSGHTDHDLLVGAGNVLFTGDLLEAGSDPVFEDAFPVDWVRTLGKMAALEDLYDVFVPGHGEPVAVQDVVTQMNTMRSAIRVTRVAMDEASVDMTKAIPILPYGPEQSRALLIRLRTLAHWKWLTRRH
ncbi:MBL fold metallo-hydrolase [Arthrobacter pityocampae]|uniref:MBL fold metallo-hydrolase n=1 Tax=Arthrobacter pityocampae TaxID=547334 RepID=A0A2S5IWU7_9MICC|nr:MBL fold metallo-hydrolase [Arthrobacter pityocampae]PPB49062.1 MBL fold metallo-hydrolase [Arthrobacter pityocampae]